ncbi:MAG: succinylglutamate desuccinylase/aspartoacylase family protein, partial [Pseudomonadales bacterium]
MAHSIETIELKSPTPGVSRALTVHCFKGEQAGPKVYLQAALHADEWPGLLTLQHLLAHLIACDARGDICGEIVLVPYANPIGMDQRVNGTVIGRHAFSAEGNFNRNWPDFSAVLAAALDEQPDLSLAQLREKLQAAVASLSRDTPLQELRAALLSLSIDADIVLDLHCDSQALVHLYANYRSKREAQALAGFIHSPVVLLEDEPGGSPFDAAHIKHWVSLEDRLPLPCFSATIELRGEADVSDELAAGDAKALLAYLASSGALAKQAAPEVEPYVADYVTNLTAMDSVSAPCAGIVCWHKKLGDSVVKGELVAEVVDLTAADPAAGRTPIYSRTSGLLFTKLSATLVGPGEHLAKIAGFEEL